MYRALVSFSGLVSMTMGEVKEIKNEKIAKDLLRARYIEEVKAESKVMPKPKNEPKTEEKAEPKEEVKETKKKTTRKRKTPKKEG